MQKTLAPDKHEINKIQRAFSSVYKIQGRGAVVMRHIAVAVFDYGYRDAVLLAIEWLAVQCYFR